MAPVSKRSKVPLGKTQSNAGCFNTKRKIIVAVLIVVIIGASVGAYFAFKQQINNAAGFAKLYQQAKDRIGYSNDISKKNLLEEDVVGGYKILSKIDVNQYIATDIKVSDSKRYFQNGEALKSHFSNEFGLDGKYTQGLAATFGGTFNLKTSSTTSSISNQTSLLLDYTELLATYSLVHENVDEYQLDDTFINDFLKLPAGVIKDPHTMSAWADYTAFAKYGTHVTTQVDMGSRLQYWQSTNSNTQDSKKAMEVKLCASLEGTPQYKINACNTFKKEDYEMAEKSDVTKKTLISGGTKEKKAEILANPQAAPSFFTGNPYESSAIRFKFKPLSHYIEKYLSKHNMLDENNKSRISLMKSYYLLMHKGCTYKTEDVNLPATGESPAKTEKMVLRKLEYCEASKAYVCRVRKQGCQVDADCNGGFLYGPSAVHWDSEGNPFIHSSPSKVAHPSCQYSSITFGYYCQKNYQGYVNAWTTNEA